MELKSIYDYSQSEVAIQAASSDSGLIGYVAFGRVSPTSLGEVNFDTLDSQYAAGTKPVAEGVFVAKWGVNLRENNLNTTEGNNPIVDTISAGECVQILKVEGAVIELRGQFWAQVEVLEDCSPKA